MVDLVELSGKHWMLRVVLTAHDSSLPTSFASLWPALSDKFQLLPSFSCIVHSSRNGIRSKRYTSDDEYHHDRRPDTNPYYALHCTSHTPFSVTVLADVSDQLAIEALHGCCWWFEYFHLDSHPVYHLQFDWFSSPFFRDTFYLEHVCFHSSAGRLFGRHPRYRQPLNTRHSPLPLLQRLHHLVLCHFCAKASCEINPWSESLFAVCEEIHTQVFQKMHDPVPRLIVLWIDLSNLIWWQFRIAIRMEWRRRKFLIDHVFAYEHFPIRTIDQIFECMRIGAHSCLSIPEALSCR